MTLDEFILQDFVPTVAQIMDIYARKWELPLNSTQIKEAQEYIQDLCKHRSLQRICEKAKKMEDMLEPPMAARLYHHDLRGEINYCLQISGFPNELSEKIVNVFMRKLTIFRLFGLTMGYLSSEQDKDYLTFFPSSQLMPLLESASRQSREIHVCSSREINNVEFVALYEIIKNAPGHWDLYVTNKKPFTCYNVHDFGPGIRAKKDASGKALPLPAQEYPHLFEDFSTKVEEGGLGLQVVKKLVHSLRGHVEITSTTEESTIHYSTQSEKIYRRSPVGLPGTLFSCYFPQEYSPIFLAHQDYQDQHP